MYAPGTKAAGVRASASVAYSSRESGSFELAHLYDETKKQSVLNFFIFNTEYGIIKVLFRFSSCVGSRSVLALVV